MPIDFPYLRFVCPPRRSVPPIADCLGLDIVEVIDMGEKADEAEKLHHQGSHNNQNHWIACHKASSFPFFSSLLFH
mgnify:CR=1 FL=1